MGISIYVSVQTICIKKTYIICTTHQYTITSHTYIHYTTLLTCASLSTRTSKANIVAYSGRPFSFIILARITSFLYIGPMLMCDTGIAGLHSYACVSVIKWIVYRV